MKEQIINQIVIPILVALIGTVMELGRREIKKYLNSKKELIEKQKLALQTSMGIQQYNRDKELIKDSVKAVEQLGKEFDWQGALKHSKVLELIENKTSLSSEEIYNIIKAAVFEVNSEKN